jgi:effector-binding domain-containing protein
MKLLLASLFALIGVGKFLSWPVGEQLSGAPMINAVSATNDTVKKPVFTLEERTITPFTVLAIRDTANTMTDIGRVLGRDYGQLYTFIKQKNLKPGRMIAFYYSYQPTFILEAAVEVDTFPRQLSGRVTVREITGGKAIIAHYKGPYEQIAIAYAAVANRLKEHNMIADGPPFEVYLNDPMLVSDPFELRTDVCQLIKMQ